MITIDEKTAEKILSAAYEITAAKARASRTPIFPDNHNDPTQVIIRDSGYIIIQRSEGCTIHHDFGTGKPPHQPYFDNLITNQHNDAVTTGDIKGETNMSLEYTDGSFRVRRNGLEYRFMYNGKQKCVNGKTEEICWQRRFDKTVEWEKEATGSSPAAAQSPAAKPAAPATFGEWIKHWFETYKIPHISAQSKDRSQSIINKHILPALGSIPLNKLNHDNLQTFLNGFIATPNSQKKIYDIIHGSLEKCRVSGKIKTNPADGLTVKRYTKKKRKALQVAEQLAMFEYLETRDPKYAKLAMFSCCTGIRIGRVVELTDKDVDHERGEIIVKMKQKLGLEETYRVPFLPELLDGLPTKGKLFPDINISAAQDFFKRVFNKLKIEDVTIHSFRHTFVSMLYHIGVSLKQIQELAGHKTLSITADVYTHIIKNSGDSPILNYLKRLKEFLNI